MDGESFHQRTFKQRASFDGIGLHTGEPVRLTLAPAPADTGIVFVRTDLAPELEIPAQCGCVVDAVLNTSLGRDGVRIGTVEHILAAPITDRAQIDSHRDQLAGATKDAIGAVAAALDPSLSREALFDAQEGRAELSQRLRLDLCVFREMCRMTAERLSQPDADVAMVQPLRRFSLEFRDVGYQLLRHSDRELFDRFLALLESWGSLENTPPRVQRLREDCRRFGEILDRALENVNKRAELQKLPLDEQAVREALARRMKAV